MKVGFDVFSFFLSQGGHKIELSLSPVSLKRKFSGVCVAIFVGDSVRNFRNSTENSHPYFYSVVVPVVTAKN